MIIFDEQSKWPLQMGMRTGNKAGFELDGYFDAVDYFEYPDAFGNRDIFAVIISNFETDSPTSSAVGIPFCQLMPCEEIRISLALEHYSLLDRPTSRCRNDYPQQLKSLLNAAMTADLFYNPVFAPNLPYDQNTCNSMCFANYWWPQCSCYGNPEIWRYAGFLIDYPPCPFFGENCSQMTTLDAPATVMEQCECHQKCNGYRFRIASKEKIRYSYGNKTTL